MGCIFCRIASGELPAKLVYETDEVIAFHDINPVAPQHVLIIPRAHVERVDDPRAEHYGAAMLSAAAQIARELGLAAGGFRLVCNTGLAGGQTVGHLHFHLLGGRDMQWPPG